jgi:hypothetical protein
MKPAPGRIMALAGAKAAMLFLMLSAVVTSAFGQAGDNLFSGGNLPLRAQQYLANSNCPEGSSNVIFARL